MQTFQTEQQSNIMHELKSTITSFTFICGIWQQMSNLVNLDSQLDSSHHLVSQVSKSPIVDPQASSILWNPHLLRPLHVGDDFLGHPNGAASTPNLLPNLVSNHLTICLFFITQEVLWLLFLRLGLVQMRELLIVSFFLFFSSESFFFDRGHLLDL